MDTYIVQYTDTNGRYQGWQVTAPSYQSAIETCNRTVKDVEEILGCYCLRYIAAPTKQKGFKGFNK